MDASSWRLWLVVEYNGCPARALIESVCAPGWALLPWLSPVGVRGGGGARAFFPCAFSCLSLAEVMQGPCRVVLCGSRSVCCAYRIQEHTAPVRVWQQIAMPRRLF